MSTNRKKLILVAEVKIDPDQKKDIIKVCEDFANVFKKHEKTLAPATRLCLFRAKEEMNKVLRSFGVNVKTDSAKFGTRTGKPKAKAPEPVDEKPKKSSKVDRIADLKATEKDIGSMNKGQKAEYNERVAQASRIKGGTATAEDIEGMEEAAKSAYLDIHGAKE